MTDEPKKRGRPATGTDPLTAFRAPPEIIEALDAASRNDPDHPSRSELIRWIVSGWLKKRGYLKELK